MEQGDQYDDATFRKSMRRKVAGAILIAAISTGAALASCAGQGIAYRQMRAIESLANGHCK